MPGSPHVILKLKPGAHWSDEYKKRMQADMDLLTAMWPPLCDKY
jgi:hypothetical protein